MLRVVLKKFWFLSVLTAAGIAVLADDSSSVKDAESRPVKVTDGNEVAQAPSDSAKVPSGTEVESAEAEKNAGKKDRQILSDEDQAAVMSFVAENHPELGRLLEQLRKSRAQDFARAIRELSQQKQQLDRVRERNPNRYSQQLDQWKHDSQIRLLMARWSRKEDPELESQIRELLRLRQEAKRTQLKADQSRLVEQLRKVEEQLSNLGDSSEAQIDLEWKQMAAKASPKKGLAPKQKNSPKKDTID